MTTDASYYAFREKQERGFAADASSPQIAAIHIAMADAYSARADEQDRSATNVRPFVGSPTR